MIIILLFILLIIQLAHLNQLEVVVRSGNVQHRIIQLIWVEGCKLRLALQINFSIKFFSREHKLRNWSQLQIGLIPCLYVSHSHRPRFFHFQADSKVDIWKNLKKSIQHRQKHSRKVMSRKKLPFRQKNFFKWGHGYLKITRRSYVTFVCIHYYQIFANLTALAAFSSSSQTPGRSTFLINIIIIHNQITEYITLRQY
jgi:hypothetical protein